MSNKTRFLSAAALVGISQWMAAPVLAQTDPAAPQPQTQQADQGAEAQGEIVVTARKRNERLLDVPVAISAISQETIERYAVNSLSAIGQQIPQLVVAESQNQVGGSINLRGIGAGVSNPSTEQSVTINLDGVPVSYGNGVRLGQLDLQRVEVLKGPQALFYGKNSPGGIVSLISQDPGQEFEAQVRGGYEFEAKQRFIEGIVSGALTDTIGARVVAYYSKEDGWFRNIGIPVAGRTPGPAANSLNAKDVFLRGTLTFKDPSGNFHLKAKLNYGSRERDGVGPAGLAQIRVCPFGFSQVSGRAVDCGLDRKFADVALRPQVAALHPALGDGVPFADSKQFLGSLNGDYTIAPNVTLTSVTGYYRLHEDSLDSFTFVTVPAVAATNNIHIRSFSQELRLASDFDGPFNFLLGGYYQKGRFTIAQVVPIDLGGACPSATCFLTPFTFYRQDTTAYSGFAQMRFKFTEQLELAAGARLSTETKRLTGTVNNTPFTILNPKKDYHDLSPDITLTYKPNRDLTLFAAYREGFTSGGFNTVPTAINSPAFPTTPVRDLSFDQMTAKGGELGAKGYLLDRQLMFDLVGYYYKYKGLQLSRFDTVQVVQLTQNAGGAKVRGIEFSTNFRPRAVPGLELRGTVDYNKATYSPFLGACYPGQSIAAGCNLKPRNPALAPATFGTAANPFTAQDQTGQQIARAPKWTLNGGITYDRQLGAGLGGSISMDVTYTSSYMTQIEAQPEARQPGYWMLNGNLTLYGGQDRGWQVALIGRNLTNKIVAISGGAVAFVGTGTGTAVTTPADLYGSVSLPRQIILQLTLKNTLLK
jgi:iron complex outermembrane receptor protein